MDAHSESNYLAWLQSTTASSLITEASVKHAVVTGPVKVDIYDSNGKRVGQAVNKISRQVNHDEVEIILRGHETHIYLPYDDTFRIVITGTAAGKLKYMVEDIDVLHASPTVQKTFAAKDIVLGDEWVSQIPFDLKNMLQPELIQYGIEKAKIAAIKDAAFKSGKEIKPTPKVTMNGKKLKEKADYQVTYQNNTAVGLAVITIAGLGDYGGQVTKTFKINPQKATIKKTKAASKAFTITWKKLSDTKTYKVSYKLKTEKKWKTKSVSAKKTELTIKKLKAGKAYQVRVCAVQKVKGKKYTGAWSAAKTVTVR
jgi:hypothetical protein